MVFALKTIKHWLSRPHKVAVALLILVTASYGVFQSMPAGAAACSETSGTDVVLENCDLSPGSYYYSGTLLITGTVTAGTSGSPGQVYIFSDNITISSTGTLTATGLGYSLGSGPGAGGNASSSGGGGAHGGDGGDSHYGDLGGTAYGSVKEPTSFGSGGGLDGASANGDGGGAIHLVTTSTGTLTVDGTIVSNGENATAAQNGGGAGGSIWLDAGTLDGDGSIAAIGGDATSSSYGGGGGGGGRIAIYYGTDNSSLISGEKYSAYGGSMGSTIGDGDDGGAGTVFIDDGTGSGDLIIDNNSATDIGDTSTTTQDDSDLTFDNITVTEGSRLVLPNGKSLTLSATGTLFGGGTTQARISIESGGIFDSSSSTFNIDDIDVINQGSFKSMSTMVLADGAFTHEGDFGGTTLTEFRGRSGGNFRMESTSDVNLTSMTIGNGSTFTQTNMTTLSLTSLTIESGGEFTHANNTTSKAYAVDVSATTIDIQSGGTVSANAVGYDLGYGPGAGGTESSSGGGGGHGGDGGVSHYGDSGGGTYGSVREPTTLGSGGGVDGNSANGDGGGAIKLVASGTITIDGTVTANGGTATYVQNGGGAGGSVWIDASTLDGDGSVSAIGGDAAPNSYGGGGGGGGRIAIYYTTDNSTLISGEKYSAYGGGKGSTLGGADGDDGGAGTVYIDDGTGSGDYIVDNNSITDIGTTSTTTQVETGLTFDNITIAEGAQYIVDNGQSLNLSATGTLTTDGTTRPSMQVVAGGTFDTGASSFTFSDIDIDNDGTIATVTTLSLTDADFDHDGALSSTVTQLNFTAASGTTYFRNNGTGFNDLTLQVENNGYFVSETTGYDNLTSLTVKNTGIFSQANTAALDITTVTVENGGKITHGSNSTSEIYHLDITSTTFDIQSGGSVDVATQGFNPGYGTGAGEAGSRGSGAGHGGHGGRSHYANASVGGPTYGSVREPVELGSGGGNLNSGYGGEGGGAVKLTVSGTLTIDGTVNADGENPSDYRNGGGAGGSIWIDAATLDGDGSVTAQGGDSAGSSYGSGGGGGGRIAIYYTTDNSTIVSGGKHYAYGGTGIDSIGDSESGGAGTVFIDDRTGSGDYIVDNNSLADTGTTSTTDQSETGLSFDNITIKGGTKYVMGSGESLTLSATGTLTGGGTNQASVQVGSGATLDPSATTFTVDDLDIDLDGTLASATTLTLSDTDFDHDGSLSATVTQLDFAAATSTIFRNNGSGFNDLTLQVENNGTFVSEATGYDNLTSLTVKNTGTFSQAHTSTINITTVTIESGGTVSHGSNSTSKLYILDIAATTFDIQSGGSVNVEADGFNPGQGPGAGGGGSRGAGAGYGGAGGRSHYADNPGGTYGSATAPDDLGSGGGNLSTSYGGDGGGAVKLVISGTLTVNGTINADGDDPNDYRNGGGSGGSIWLDVDTYAGSGSISAEGGSTASTSYGSGGGGGGRIYITYNTKTYSGTTPSVLGGLEGDTLGNAEDGQPGTFTEEVKPPVQPTINGITVSPGTPTDSQNFTISASATFETGLDYVELFLDGTELANRVAICYSGTATNTECTYEHNPISGGSHTAYVKATGDDASTASDSVAFFVSTNTTENVATLERHKAGESTSFALTFTLTNTLSSQLTITFPGSFTVTGAFTQGTCTSGTISNFGFTSTTLTADKSSCTGTVTLSGATITLPGSAGLYEVTWENDDPGSVVIPVTDDDAVTVSADVASELVFDLDISTSDSDTDAPYTLALGSLTSGSVIGSDDVGINGIWVDLDTNATAGAVVQVQSSNAALASASAPGDTVPSTSGDVDGGSTARYGICVATAGNGVPTASVGTFQDVAPFDGTTGGSLGCTTSNASVGALTTSFQTILNTNSDPVDAGRAQIRVKVQISDATVGHDDYSDTLTFRATSTF